MSKSHSYHHINPKTGQAPKRPKVCHITILQGQQQLQQTTTPDLSSTKHQKMLLKR